MESKTVIFLVFASLAQGSNIPRYVISDGLSEEQVIVLDKIVVNQVATSTAYSDAVEALFEVFLDLEATTDEHCTELREALIGVKTAVDLSYESISIAFGESCSACPDARSKSHDYLYDAAEEVAAAFKLARFGNYCENRDAIEIHEAKVSESLKNVFQSFYDSIRACLTTTDVNILSVIDIAENGSLIGKKHLVGALFNAIKNRAVMADGNYSTRSYITDTEDFADKAAFAFNDDVEYKYSLLKTFVVLPILNKIETLPELYWNQYALTVSYNRYVKGNVVIFNTLFKYLRKIKLGLYDDTDVAFFLNDVDSPKAAAFWNAGEASNAKSIEALHPESLSTIDATRQMISDANIGGIAVYYSVLPSIVAPGGNYSETLDAIAFFADQVEFISPYVTDLYFKMIRNEQSFPEEIESKLASLKEKTLNANLTFTVQFVEAIKILGNSAHTGEVSEDDFSEMEALLDLTNSACAEISQAISASSLLVLQYNNAN